MAELTVVIASHYFAAIRFSADGRTVIEKFARRFAQYGYKPVGYNRVERGILKVFAAANAARTEYRFHINVLEEFKQHLELYRLKDHLVEWHQLPPIPAITTTYAIDPKYTDREYQPPIIEYMVSPEKPPLKLVALQTGKGKSYCTMRAMQILGYRTVIFVRPMYLEKWYEDMMRTFSGVKEDFMVVKGSAHLMALLQLAAEDALPSKVIIISNKTMQNWLKLYENFGAAILDMGYACLPDQLCAHLGAGIRVIDEVHQDFHLNFKLDLYTHTLHSISLSASLVSDDEFTNRMYEIPYPTFYRFKGPTYHKYIAAFEVRYRFVNPNKLRYKSARDKSYSHNEFEKSLLKLPMVTNNYLQLINHTLKNSYFRNYQPGDKAIIFCASIAMCSVVTDYLKKLYRERDVRRYVEEDPWENLMDADIRVTTLQSAGTAVDIAQLTTTILTVAIASSQGNIQGFGRLRELKDGRTPEFHFFVCEDIAKHCDYRDRKKTLLNEMALTYRAITVQQPV